MKYCRISIEHTTRGCVYQKDFDAQHVFGPLVQAFAGEMVRQGTIPEGERYTSIIFPRYDDALIENPIIQIDQARAQEPFPSWFNLMSHDARTYDDQPLAFFTMELRFQQSGIIYRQDLQVVSLDYFWQNIQTALLHMHVLQDGDLYVSRITVRDDDQVDFSREEVQNVAPEETLIELVEVESSEPDFPQRSPAHFDVVEVKNVESVSPVELGQPDTARQDDVQIFIAQDTLEALQGIARQAVQVEQGGVLVGQVYRQPEASERYLVEIAGHIVAEGTSANVAEFRYNFDSWLRQSELLKERFPGQQIVGWYHTHLVTVAIQPDEPSQELQTTELFFSDHDRFMHRRFFSDQWYVAMVLNPQGNAAFFRWFDDKISSNQRFYVFRPEHPARERP